MVLDERYDWTSKLLYVITVIAIAHGTCLGVSLVRVSVDAIADNSPINNENGLAAEVCVVGILLCTLCYF